MKNLLTLLFFFSFSVLSFSQVIVEGVNINELKDVQLCRIVASSKLLSNKVVINIDYGQATKLFSKTGSSVRGKDGKPKVFNSTIDAMNYLETNGWNYLDAYVITAGNINVYHYTFKKEE